nr:putative capsid protein [Crucivirus sp.]
MPAPARKTYAAKPKKKYAKQQKVRSTYLKRDNRAPSEVALNASRRAGTSDMGSMLGGLAGMALGGPTGAMIGNAVGGIGGNIISRLFGSGDYKTNAEKLTKNNLVLSNAAQAPQFGSGRVMCKFRHREYLGDVFSSETANTFKIDSYAINPGVASTFPWLSGVVGAKFQQYRINGCVFEFRSMSSDALNSTNTALGSVIMSTDYDSADNVFTSKQEMENTEYGVSCKPSINMIHGIECKRSQTPVSELYIRAFDVPAGKDIRLYDLGRFSIATTGCQGTNVNLGELWVSYDIDAFKAIEQVPQYLTPFAQYTLNAVDATHALGTSQTVIADEIGITFEYVAGVASVILPHSMPAGTIFSIFIGVLGSSTALVPTMDIPVISPSLDALGTGNGWQGYAACPYPGPATTDFKALYTTYKYNGLGTPANPPKLSVAGGVVPTAITLANLTISFMSGALPSDGQP